MSTARAEEPQGEASAPEDAAVYEAPAVLRLLWADPQYMPEHLALWSLKRFGPRASSAVEKLRVSHPGADQAELEAAVIQHQTRVSMTEGAFVGGPFIVLLPVAFCAALLAQAQMALELAALAGYAPDDEMRAADLLVIQGAYASTAEASAALARLTRGPSREGKRLPRGTRISMVKRMAYMLGVLGSSGEEKPSRLRSALQMVSVGAVFLVGLVLPLVWVPYMALAFRKSGLRMGAQASAFYAERRKSWSPVRTVNSADRNVRGPDSDDLADRRAGCRRRDRPGDGCGHRQREMGQRGDLPDRGLRAGHPRLVLLPPLAPARPPAAQTSGRVMPASALTPQRGWVL